jgi:predicted RNase H-like nuclease (RuvC/YqgF family)
MARRRLSDLLREEANKPSDEATAAAEAEQSDAEDSDVAEAAAAIEPSTATKASTAAKNRSTKQTAAAEPQATPAPKQDDALLQKIADLTAALEAQKATVTQLQTELEQTRKEARQLTDSNAKLTQELKTLQAQKTGADTSALTKASESHAPQELKLAPPPAAAEPENSLKSFNRDVGWFD